MEVPSCEVFGLPVGSQPLAAADWPLRTAAVGVFLGMSQEVRSLLDQELDNALRAVLLSTAEAACAHGFQVQAFWHSC